MLSRTQEMQEEILRLKKEKNMTILAHSYQREEVQEIADFVGDSFQLSVKAQSDPNPSAMMCGVRFMAETVKILSPEKRVWMPSPQAGCPMAEQFLPEQVEEYKRAHPQCTVVAYVNTTAGLKTVCDVCVTSSSAVAICEKIESGEILFLPDCNLGSYVAGKLPHKKIVLMEGGCPIHASVTPEEARDAKERHPGALLLTHPECVPGVLELSDFVGSTSEIIQFAKESGQKEFIIGTEIAIREHLSIVCPEKSFYLLSKKLICPDMKLTTLYDVLSCLKGTAGEEIVLEEAVLKKARRCIEEMLRLG